MFETKVCDFLNSVDGNRYNGSTAGLARGARGQSVGYASRSGVMPRPGESGVMRKPLSGERGAWRRSWVSRGPVAKPQAWGMFSAAAKCKAEARPTPVSREEVSTAPRATGPGVLDNRAGSGDTADSCELDDKDVYGTRLCESCGGLCVLDGLVGGDGDGGVEVESGEGWDVGWGYGFFNELGGEFGQTVRGRGRLGFLARRGWHPRRSLMASPTALRVRARASSSILRSRPPTFSLRVRKPSSTAFAASTSVSAGVGLSDNGVDFNRVREVPPRKAARGSAFGLGEAVQRCGLKGEGEGGWRNGVEMGWRQGALSARRGRWSQGR